MGSMRDPVSTSKPRLEPDLRRNLHESLRSVFTRSSPIHHKDMANDLKERHYHIQETRNFAPLTMPEWHLVLPPVDNDADLRGIRAYPGDICLVRSERRVYRVGDQVCWETGRSLFEPYLLEDPPRKVFKSVEIDADLDLRERTEIPHGFTRRPTMLEIHSPGYPDCLWSSVDQSKNFQTWCGDTPVTCDDESIIISDTLFDFFKKWTRQRTIEVRAILSCRKSEADAIAAANKRLARELDNSRTGFIDLERRMTPEEEFATLIDELGNVEKVHDM